MWPFTALQLRHWIFLLAAVFFLASYFGLLTWGQIEKALELLAGPAEESEAITRGEAFVVTFLFLMLTPLAGLSAFGLFAFAGAVLTGLARTVVRTDAIPDWLLSVVVQATIVGGLYYWRDAWFPALRALLRIIARAILIAAG